MAVLKLLVKQPKFFDTLFLKSKVELLVSKSLHKHILEKESDELAVADNKDHFLKWNGFVYHV